MPTVANIADFLQAFAPLELAEEWDNVGLLLGDKASCAERIMTCLTVTPITADEAIENRAELIVSHHPILFRGCKQLTAESAESKMLLSLIRAGIAVYSPHTAFDNTRGGINDMLAARLGLTSVGPLRTSQGDKEAGRQGDICKIVVFVPEKDLHQVSDAMFAAGAGHIGQYSQCSFRIPGTGTFFGSQASNPTLGQKGRLEEVGEFRLEVICPEEVVHRVVAALRKVHSYEEPAYDVYLLYPDPAKIDQERLGQGRIGQLVEPVSLATLAEMVRSKLSAPNVQIVGEGARSVQRVAIVCGAGGDFVGNAAGQKADVLLTGEARFHDCLAAQAQGLAVLLPGHYPSERPGVEELSELIQRQFPQTTVWASRKETDPLQM